MGIDNRIDKLERDSRRAKTSRAEVATGITRILFSALPIDFIAGRLFFVRDFMTGIMFVDNGTQINPINRLPNIAFIDLPATVNNGIQVYVTNGRKPAEGVGGGTGVSATFTNGNWYSDFDGAVVVI